jgi:soluble lytic murein transglycosylase-like protein
MHLRTRRSVAAAALAAVVVVLAPAAVAQDLDEAVRERDAAEAGRAAAEQRLAQLGAEVAAGEEELDRLGADLAAVEQRLEPARTALAAAERRRDGARARLGAARDRLAEVRTALDRQQERLAEHARELYQQGAAGGAAAGMFESLLGAGDEGTLAERLPYLQVLVSNDVVLLEDAEALSTAEQGAAREVRRATAQAEAQQRAAAEAVAATEALVAERSALLAASRVAQDRRLALFAELQSDVAAQAVLVQDLSAQVALLQRARVGEPPAGPVPPWADRLPAGGPEWAPAIEAAATAERVDPRLLAALVWTESTFRPDVVSPAGAIGLTQLLPGTAREVGVDPFDPVDNLHGGARYLRGLLDRYPGRADLALAAYNAGPGNVDDAGPGIPPFPETQLYVVRILDRYDLLAAP